MNHIAVDARMIKSSGIGKVIEHVLKRLILQRREWTFTLIGQGETLNEFPFATVSNVRVTDCSAPIYSIREQWAIPGKVPADADVLWVPHYNIPIFYGGKLLVTIHDVAHLALPQFVHGLHKKFYAHFMMRRAAHADRIVTVSEFTARELVEYVGADARKIQVVYNGVDESWFRIPEGERLYPKPYLIFVGNVKPHKNLVRLLKAFRRVMDRVPYDLLIVGKKDGFLTGDDNVFEEARILGDRVQFTGYVTDEDLQQYVKQAAAMVFPSLYEGFGLPPVEAMAAGCPVLCSDAASLPEICGDAALYFDPLDETALAECILSLPSLGTNPDVLKARAKRFSWDDTAETMGRILETI